MIVVAIVGASRLTKEEEFDVSHLCVTILKSYTGEITVISGGAEGVDSIAIEVAKGLNLKTREFLPEVSKWDPPSGLTGFKKRNLQIVDQCDDLYCIAIQFRITSCYHHSPSLEIEHECTAGCWTMNKASLAGKNCKLFITRKHNG